METTGLLDILRDRLGIEESTQSAPDPPPEIVIPQDTDTHADQQPSPQEPPARQLPSEQPSREQPPPATPRQDPPTEAPQPPPEEEIELRSATLYYIRVSDDGRITPVEVSRQFQRGTAPLTENIRHLISGPSAQELNQGLLNLIPSNARLLSASVNNRVAYLSFNDDFSFNSLGTEGLVAQLQQIVYTATEFSTVDRVQFLINGEQVEYLGGDGVFIGQPLGRGSFR